MPSEISARAAFSAIRYGQVWEDADTLLAGLDIRPGDTCLSIASAGDNALAMLTRDPARVVAVDLNPAQLHCLALRMEAYRRLSHGELLVLMGSRPGLRAPLYARCRPGLDEEARRFWDAHPGEAPAGIGGAGKFERYFARFRRWVLPLIHGRRTVRALVEPRSPEERRRFYDGTWDTRRWRALFKVFFSRFVMGRMGRDPAFFRYVEGSVADRILGRTRHALRDLDPSANPYLQWILFGEHPRALPLALREEHFATIRDRLDRLEGRLGAVEDVLRELGPGSIDRFNLSDIFEYMGTGAAEALLAQVAAAGRRGGRLAYWNLLAPRSRPESLAERLRPQPDLAVRLLQEDKAWFYSALVLEELT